ncbi:hypothetical protein EVAR_87133_1 [Eumeta japonica]|uniref:Uncharacterized protein n=1 Tax=Eumeta variegata TaxID=151549 RepID=A0A4C1VW12_EUMVA|nr:hypothetical protein EVAR_87133_1 [Eumeta japonica]
MPKLNSTKQTNGRRTLLHHHCTFQFDRDQWLRGRTSDRTCARVFAPCSSLHVLNDFKSNLSFLLGGRTLLLHLVGSLSTGNRRKVLRFNFYVRGWRRFSAAFKNTQVYKHASGRRWVRSLNLFISKKIV